MKSSKKHICNRMGTGFLFCLPLDRALRGRVCTVRAQRRHSTHMTGRNRGVLLQLAIFLPIQTILHPHNVGQPDVCKGGGQEYCNRTWDSSDSVSPRPGEPVVVWTGAVTSSPQACGTPHNQTRNQNPGRIAATRLGQPCDTRAGRFQKGGQLHGEALLQGPVPPPVKGLGGREKTEKLPKCGSANKS